MIDEEITYREKGYRSTDLSCGSGKPVWAICEGKNCEKDLCDKCVGHEGYASGDYRVVYCQKCWDIGDDYREKIAYLEEQVEQLYEEWKSRCNCSR